MVYPLFFDYPSDDNCFADIEHTYMLGDSLKVSPVLSAGVKTTYNAYFPAGKWADMNDFSNILTSTGGYIALNQSYAYTNVHLKEGKIVPY
jgi:alpha-glucosidase (family GH31 glycosyl hydrolase)